MKWVATTCFTSEPEPPFFKCEFELEKQNRPPEHVPVVLGCREPGCPGPAPLCSSPTPHDMFLRHLLSSFLETKAEMPSVSQVNNGNDPVVTTYRTRPPIPLRGSDGSEVYPTRTFCPIRNRLQLFPGINVIRSHEAPRAWRTKRGRIAFLLLQEAFLAPVSAGATSHVLHLCQPQSGLCPRPWFVLPCGAAPWGHEDQAVSLPFGESD